MWKKCIIQVLNLLVIKSKNYFDAVFFSMQLTFKLTEHYIFLFLFVCFQYIFQSRGADGTQYAELAMMTEKSTVIKKPFRVSPRSSTAFTKTTIYAVVDHTADNPIRQTGELNLSQNQHWQFSQTHSQTFIKLKSYFDWVYVGQSVWLRLT